MSFYMSVDGGGTKIDAVLFNERFELIGSAQAGSINPNVVTAAEIHENMENCIRQCLSRTDIEKIDCLYMAMPGPRDLFTRLLSRRVPVKNRINYSEGRMCLLAGIQMKQGLVALSGTGSVAFYVNDDLTQSVGGWGGLLSDEGSGYAIGRNGLNAAIRFYDGRGPATLIHDLLLEHWQLDNLTDLISVVYKNGCPAKVIASAARIVGIAADKGDAVAIGIYRKAGADMAALCLALLRKLHGQYQNPLHLMIAGGAWKGSSSMLQSFKDRVASELTGPFKLHRPLFEPVIGGVIAQAAIERHLSAAERLGKDIDYKDRQFVDHNKIKSYNSGCMICPDQLQWILTQFSDFRYRLRY